MLAIQCWQRRHTQAFRCVGMSGSDDLFQPKVEGDAAVIPEDVTLPVINLIQSQLGPLLTPEGKAEMTLQMCAGLTTEQITHRRETAQTMVNLMQSLLNVYNDAIELQTCCKDVHFVTGIDSCKKLVLHLAMRGNDGVVTLVHNESGHLPRDIIACSFIVVSAVDQPYANGIYSTLEVEVVHNVKILIESARANVPGRLTFTTGGWYFLSDGYSVNNCWNLPRIFKLSLSQQLLF